MEFKDRIRELREEKGMSSSKLAVEFDKSESAIRSWETGRTKPDADTLITLSKFFNVSTDYLLGLVDARNPENLKLVSEIGLSEKAIQFLGTLGLKHFDGDPRTYRDIISTLLETPTFYTSFLYHLAGLSCQAGEEILAPKLKWLTINDKTVKVKHFLSLTRDSALNEIIHVLENEYYKKYNP